MIQFCTNLYRHRELLHELVWSNIKARYKQSILGIGWAIVQPLALMLVSVFIFSQVAKFPSDHFPYPIFAYTALIAWTLLSTSLSSAVPSLVNNISLLRKVYFPREIFIVTNILIALVDYGIAAVLLVGMLVFYRIPLHAAILYLPVILLIQLIFMTGLSLVGAIVNVAFRDIARGLPILLQIWMLASPVFYPISMIPPQWRFWYSLNPMVGIIEGYRSIWLDGTAPAVDLLAISLLEAVLMFVVGYALFCRGEEVVNDIV
ncbi:MAG: ABC transporter permease [Patescibacteria group bacterium]|nr:ABC transporter permease [Patescibacteria group bacterium]